MVEKERVQQMVVVGGNSGATVLVEEKKNIYSYKTHMKGVTSGSV